jgi:hypothetical protein
MSDIFDLDHEEDLPPRYVRGPAAAGKNRPAVDASGQRNPFISSENHQKYQQQRAERQVNRDRYQVDLSDDDYAFINKLFPNEMDNKEYVDNRYRVATAVQLSRLYEIPFESAYKNMDTILEATYTEKKIPKDAFKAVSDSFALGTNQVKLSALGVQLMAHEVGAEERNKICQEIQQIKADNLTLQDGVTRNMFLEGVKGFGESWLFTASAAGAGALGSLATPAVGVIAAAAVSATQMAGLEYVNLLDAGIDPDTAKTVAVASGAIQGVIEATLGDVAALGTRTGLGQLIFKRLHYAGVIGAIARGVLARPIDMAMEGLEEAAQEKVSQIGTEVAKQQTEQKVWKIVSGGEADPLEKAAEDLATAAYQEYLKETSKPGNEKNTLSRESKEEQNRAIFESLKMGIFTSMVTGVMIIPKDIRANVRDSKNFKTAAVVSPDLATFKKATDDNLILSGMTAETKARIQEEVFSTEQKNRQAVEQAAEEEIRRTRLYGGTDESEGEVYRDATGNLYAEQTEHTASNGITTGEFALGNPKMGENNTYARASYEVSDGKIVLENVRMAENREGLQPEFLQAIANTSNQEIAWEGTTYSPQDGGSKAVRIGMSTQIKETAAPRAGTAEKITFTGAEKKLFESIKKVMPRIKNDLEGKVLVEEAKLIAAVNNQTLDQFLETKFEPGITTDVDANTLAAAQNVSGRQKGAVTFNPETGKALIAGSTWADFSTASHEFAHVLRRQLQGELLKEAERVFGVIDGNWTADHEEAFTRSYEKYLETGEAPTSKLAELFRKFKEFMGRIYQLIRNEHILSNDQKALFDHIFREAEANQEALENGRQGTAQEATGETDQAAAGTQREAAISGQEEHSDTTGVQEELELYQPDITPEDRVIDDPDASFPERAKAVVDKAGKAYVLTQTKENIKAVESAITEIVNGAEKSTAKGIRPDLEQYGGNGDVTFIWGDEKKGLYHIGYRRGTEVTTNVIKTVINGKIVRNSAVKKTVTLSDNGYQAVLSLDLHGTNETWVLTGWKENVPDVTGEVSTQSGTTQTEPTFSRSDLGAGTVKILNELNEEVNNNPQAFFQPEENYFQDDAVESFIENDPMIVEMAMRFESKEEFREFYNTFNIDKQPEDLAQKALQEDYLGSIWEDAQKILNGPAYTEDAVAIAGAEPHTTEEFIDLINTDQGIEDLVKIIAAIKERKVGPDSEAEQQQFEAEERVVQTTFSNPTWSMLDKNGELSSDTRHNLREMLRKNPLPYMEGYAVLSGDERWMAAESERTRLSRLDPGREEEINSASPEELQRIARIISYEGVERDIEAGTLQLDDPRIPAYEEELNKRQNENKKKIKEKKEELSDYERLIKGTEENLKKEQHIARQLVRNTSPEGLTKGRAQQVKVRKLEQERRKLIRQYNAYIKNLDATVRRNFLELRNLQNQQYETELQIEAVGELRNIRKRALRSVLRRPDKKTTHIDSYKKIEAIQSYFNKLYESVPKFIGPKAKNIMELINDFVSDEDYRETLQHKLKPHHYQQIERIIYSDRAAKQVRNYQDITKAQRNQLYTLLLENEKLFKDLGIDTLTPAPRVSPAVHESLRDIIPADLLFKLENVNLADWQLTDVQSLASHISELRRQGKEAYRVKMEARRRLYRETRDSFDKQVLQNLGKHTNPDDDGDKLAGVAETAALTEKRAKPKALWYSLMNARRFFRMLDGGKDGTFYATITQREDQAYNEKMRHVVTRQEKTDAALKKAEIDIKELWSNTFHIDDGSAKGTNVTLDEMLFFHRAALNDRAWNAVVYGDFATVDERKAMKGFTDITDMMPQMQLAEGRYNKAMADLENFLSKNEKFKQVEEIIGADYDDNYDRLKEFVAEEFNEDLGSEEYYIPLKRLDAMGDVTEHDNIAEILSTAGVWEKIESGFKLNRTDIAPAYQRPVRSGLYKTWDGMVEKQEQLMAYQPFLREMRQIFESDDSAKLMNSIQKVYSAAGKDYIKKFISTVANPQAARDYSGLDTMTKLIRGHYPAAVLSWRLSSIIKQTITSPPPFFQFVTPAEYTAAAAQMISSEETRAMIKEKSVFMKTRIWDPAAEMVGELEKMYLQGKLGEAETLVTKFSEMGMKGLELIDYVCVAPGWLAAYNQKKAALTLNPEGRTDVLIDADAVRYADQVVRDTQPSSRQIDLAPIMQNKDPVKQLFLQFQVPMSVIFQNLFIDAPNNIRQGKILNGLITFGLYAMTAIAVGVLDEKDDDDKLNPKNMGINALGGFIESIPVVGGAAAYAVENLLKTGKIKSSFDNKFPITYEAGQVVNAISDEEWLKAVTNAVDMGFYATGLPVGLKHEIEKAVETGDWTILLGNK